MTAAVPPCTRENAPNVTACSTGTPDFDWTCTEIRKMCAMVTTNSRTPVRRRISSTLPASRSPLPASEPSAPPSSWKLEAGSWKLIDRYLPQQIEVRQHLAGTEHHRRELILRHLERHPGLLAQPLVEVLEHRSASGEDNPAIHDIGRQLRRSALERDPDRVDDHVDRFGERFANLLVRDGDRLGHPFDEMAPLDLHRHPLLELVGRSDFHLDRFGRPLADEQVVGLLDVLNDGFVHLVAGDAHRFAVDDPGERDDR